MSVAPASYKTWLILTIAVAVAAGGRLFDRFTTQQSGVLLVDEESGEQLLQTRLRLIQEKSELPIYFTSYCGFKIDESIIKEVISFARERGVKLVIFDSLVRVHTADENDAMKMAGVFHLLRQFSKEGMAVLLAHHNR